MALSETLDLSLLDPAPLVEVDFEATLAARKALLQSLWDAARQKNPSLPELDTLMLESETGAILNEEFTFVETLILQAINDAGKGLRLAQANGAKLDHLATTYHRTSRKIVREATSTSPALFEGEEEYRERAQLAPEALANFGLTPGGYVYLIRTAFADRISHVYPINRGNGRVEIRVLAREGDGVVDGNTLAEIARAFSVEDGSQSTDVLSVLSAEVEPTVWDVTLILRRGPDRASVVAQALAGLSALAASLRRINATQYREAIASAAHVGPVVTVRVNSPANDISGRPEAAPFIAAINVHAELL